MSPSTPHLAVGPTLEQAAEVFGEHFDDLELTTFTDLGDHVDLALLGSLSLVAGASADALMPGIVAQREALGTSAPPVYLGRPGGTVEGLGDDPPSDPSGRAPTPAPAQIPTDERAGLSPRGALMAASVALVLGLLLLAVAGVAGGATGLLVALAAEILVVQLAVLAGVAYVVRLLRRHVSDDADAAAFRDLLTHRSGRLLERSREDAARQRRRFGAVDRALADLRGTRGRVDALARLVSRGRAADPADTPTLDDEPG